ncbi:uncharacterized protein LOC120115133 isoform X1 [Hibiscus syriacus]|uniref:uncharacterized protein LOC120115133 isoform X1 n=1 Tax=Hibiscus syriacus TaxID=106335 RepID=UPI00192443CC|nr:uncharacterized protein LOC120115133 isoform X1 [Hibiscus syriacus]
MEDSYRHQHPLVLLNEDRQITNQSGVVAKCSRCGEKVSAPCFGCAEDCPFYLHKVCADAPLELNHPFHHNHPLVLMEKSPYPSGMGVICDFCDEYIEKFVYHCSCGLDFHIKCALFTFDIAENHLKELEHVALQPPVIPTKKDDEQLEDVKKCFGCWEPLANYTNFSADCGFNLHKRCVELSLQKNHMCHHKHPLLLQFNSDRLACKICEETRRRGFVYGCSSCKFVVHIECLSSDLVPVIKDERHEHPFSLFRRRAPFICDACGTEGTYSAYICCECDIIVHKKCTSLPSIIKSKWHDHAIFHNYFLPADFGSSGCVICHNAVSPEHGSYCCLDCNIAFHVRCVTKEASSYVIISREDADEISYESSITCVLERNDAGEATEIQHFKHMHNLLLSSFVGGCENSCDGCMLSISDPFYSCSQCQFFLHKTCAELPKKKQFWFHKCPQDLVLISDKCYLCQKCFHVSNAFAYECDGCKRKTCLRCVIALTPSARTCPHHEHPLLYYQDYEARCNACGETTYGAFRCKDCNFVLHHDCFSLPITVRHKCDKDLLKLTIHDDNSYSESHYCDICEKSRDPNRSFYRCEICDTCAHVRCVLDLYPFIKLGSIYEESDHSHPLTFVKKSYYYPDCDDCHRPCEDLALECTKSGCNYIVHWDCVAPHDLRRWCGFGM